MNELISSKEMLGEIKKQMFIHDIKMNEAADRIGKSKQALSNIFRSDSSPTFETIIRFLDKMGFVIEYKIVRKKND